MLLQPALKRSLPAFLGALVALAILLAAPAPGSAAGTPDLGLALDQPSTVLQGDQATVRLTASNATGPGFGYNLSYRAVLPAGVSYVGGSASSGLGAPTILANRPVAGETTLLWLNVADLSVNSTNAGTFAVDHSAVTYPIGSTFAILAGAYVNADPRYVPKFAADGTPVAGATSSTGSASAASSTTVNAIRIRKSEPSPEGELLRGVHDHQTQYTLTYENNGVQPTTNLKIDDYLPANLEFLGCGGPGADHTTDAPTNAGSAEEYPGSGPIVVPAVAGCVAPTTVETLTIDPDGPAGPLASGIYTHVQWTGLGSLAAGAVASITYRAAIPVRANTLTFAGGTPGALSGLQATNLNNNSGPEATDEQPLTNLAAISGDYNGTLPVSDVHTITRTVEDLLVRKSVNLPALAQGQISTWTLRLEASEYRSGAAITVTDTLPDGLCPLGATNLAAAPDAQDSECAPVGGALPSRPYTSAVEGSDGRYLLTWNASTDPDLALLGRNGSATITFPARTRVHYQEGFANAGSILAGDTVRNTVSTTGTARVVCAGGPSDCSGAGTAIDHDGPLAVTATDVSEASQTTALPTLEKRVAQASTNCAADSYVKTVPVYHPGDRICWQVRVAFPTALDTLGLVLTDFLPTNVVYDPTLNAGAGELFTGNDTIPGTTLDRTTDIPAAPAPGGQLHWTLPSAGVVSPSQVFEHQIATTVTLPLGAQSGDIKDNLFKMASQNTPGVTFPLRDAANFELRAPELDLTKRITAVDGSPIAATQTLATSGGQLLDFRVRVANSGDQAAEAVEVWDRLPAGMNCGDVSNISGGGNCTGGIIEWGHAPAIGPTVPAGGTFDLTYKLWIPTTISPTEAFTNTTGVRQFQTPTNQGGNFTYIPQSNIDPAQNAGANVPAADDTATVSGRALTTTKARTSPVDGTNNTAARATIGEVVHYTITTTMPRGETLDHGIISDPSLPSTRQPLVPGSAVATRDGVAVPGGFTVAETGGTPTLTFPAVYTSNTSTDEVFRLEFDVTVADVAANLRGAASLSNTGRTTYDNPAGGAPLQQNSAAITTAIVEPVLGVTKADDTTGAPVHGGQVVTYTVVLRNGAAGTPTAPAGNATISPAHESTLVDTVPSGITPLNTANDPIADGESTTSGGVWNQAARTLTFSPAATIEAGASATFTYRATVNNPAVGGSALQNSVAARTTSLAGNVAAERTANVGTSTGYAQSATNTLTVEKASIAKGADRSTLTVGDNVVYRLDITIPAQVQLYDTTITDTLPDSIDWDGYTSATCTSGCPPETAPTKDTYTPVVNGNGTTTAAWSFGDLAPTATARVVRLLYRGHLRATHRSGGASVVRSQTATNSATVSSNRTDKIGAFTPGTIPGGPFDDPSAPATHTLTVQEPGVAIDKGIAVGAGAFGNGPAFVHDGDALHYRIVVRNTGNAPLHDVTVDDAPDAELTGITLTTNAAMSTDPWTSGDPAMRWLIPGPILPGDTVTVGYDAALVPVSTLHDGQLVDNTATAPTAYGVPSAQRTADAFTYRSYSGGSDATQAVVDLPTVSLVKTTGAAGNPDSAPVQVGQSFTWRVVVTNTSATAGATALRVRDTLPRDWTYTTGSSSFSAGGAVEPTVTSQASGDELDWATTIPLAAGASTTLTFAARPKVASAASIGTGAGNPHINTASATVRSTAGSPADADGPFAAAPDTASAILSTPTLTIAKTPDAGSANAGSTVNFHVIVRNTGAVDASDVVVTDTLPASTTYTAGAATAAPAAGFSETSASATTVVWRIAALAAGAQVDLTIPVATDPSSAAGTNLVNRAEAIAAETPAPVSDNGNVVLTTSADLVASKSALPSPATAGDPLTYTLGVHNDGPSDAHGVVLHDVLPSTVTFLSASAGCTEAGGTVDCAVGDLADGADATATITVTVNSGVTTNADNTVTVSATTSDPAPANNTATSAVPVGTNYDLSVVKTALATNVLNGANATFRIVVRNAGPSTAAAVTITDPLPAGVAYVSDDRGCAEAGGTVTCMVGAMAPGGTETIDVLVTGIATGVQTNTATVSATGSPAADRDHLNDAGTASITVDPAADLALVKRGPATVAAGGLATYALEVTNNGPDDATGVQIEDTLPAGVTFDSASPGCTPAGSSPEVVTCTVGALASGAAATRQVVARVPIALGATAITNTAAVTGGEGDLVPANDTSAAVTQVGPAADLGLTKTGPETVGADGTLTWTMVVTNQGPSPATDVRLTDALPDGVTYLASGPSQGTCAMDAATGKFGCDLGTLAAGDAVQVTLTVTVPTALGGTSVTNTAAVAGAEPDEDLSDNTASATTAVSVKPATTAALQITKRPDGPAKVGAALTYTITVTNKGPAESTDTVITDALAGSVEFRQATADQGSCTQASGTVTCNLGTLANGATTRAHVTVIVTKAGQLPNIATVSSPLSDRTQSDNLAAAVVQTTQLPTRLSVDKFLVQRRLLAGHRAAYRIRVKNLGQEVATDVIVCDALPRALTLRTAGRGRIVNGKLCFDVPRLVPGHDRYFLVKVNVSSSAQGRTVRNRAIVRAANAVSVSHVDVEPLVQVRAVRTRGVTG